MNVAWPLAWKEACLELRCRSVHSKGHVHTMVGKASWIFSCSSKGAWIIWCTSIWTLCSSRLTRRSNKQTNKDIGIIFKWARQSLNKNMFRFIVLFSKCVQTVRLSQLQNEFSELNCDIWCHSTHDRKLACINVVNPCFKQNPSKQLSLIWGDYA